MNNLYAQLVGAAALLTIILSVQFKKKKNVMLVQAIANILYSIQYILLNAFSAAYLNLVTITRSLVYYEYDKRKKKISVIWPIIFSICSVIVGCFIWEGPMTIIAITITIAYNIGSYFKDPNVFRKVFLISAFGWMIYNYSVGAYVAVFGNVCEVVSTAFALKRYKRNK